MWCADLAVLLHFRLDSQELHSYLAANDFLALEGTCRALFWAGHRSQSYFTTLLRRWCVSTRVFGGGWEMVWGEVVMLL